VGTQKSRKRRKSQRTVRREQPHNERKKRGGKAPDADEHSVNGTRKPARVSCIGCGDGEKERSGRRTERRGQQLWDVTRGQKEIEKWGEAGGRRATMTLNDATRKIGHSRETGKREEARPSGG